jgi:hypothetical protein
MTLGIDFPTAEAMGHPAGGESYPMTLGIDFPTAEAMGHPAWRRCAWPCHPEAARVGFLNRLL